MTQPRLYTKAGDTGDTNLLGGERVRKDSPRTEAYGAVDELGSWLGLLAAEVNDQELAGELNEIQNRLLEAGSRLASTEETAQAYGLNPPGAAETAALEAAIDRMLDALPAQAGFILPGGSHAAATAHVARTVCRRAERRLVSFQAERDEADLRRIQVYLNRLSDYLYALARTCNRLNSVDDVPWTR